MNNLQIEPGSFRDPSGHVFIYNGRVLRSVAHTASEHYELMKTKVIPKSIESGYLIATKEVPKIEWPQELSHSYAVLEHDRIPFISYPYEWSFDQLKQAALFHLDFQLALLEDDAALSDATAYNIQFIGSKPIYIDYLSIVSYKEGEYWLAHRQFCEQFLNPLLLMSMTNIPFNNWYRGSIEGIKTQHISSLLSIKDYFSWNIFSQVFLQSKLEELSISNPRKYAIKTTFDKKFPRKSFALMLKQMSEWIGTLNPRRSRSVWQNYSVNNSYKNIEQERKSKIVSQFVFNHRPNLLVDLGSNTGDYSVEALKSGAGYVVGFEFDHNAHNKSYQNSKSAQLPFLPLWMDLSNPSPNQGWAEKERSGFAKRAKCDAVIALAVEHHLAIGKNVPLDQVVNWICGIANHGIIEFVQKTDPTIRQMLSLRDDIFANYSEEEFSNCLNSIASVVSKDIITEDGRVIYEYAR